MFERKNKHIAIEGVDLTLYERNHSDIEKLKSIKFSNNNNEDVLILAKMMCEVIHDSLMMGLKYLKWYQFKKRYKIKK